MDIPSFLVVYFCSWWIVFLMVLPFGVERDLSGPEITAHGAPIQPNLKKKMLITSVLTIFVAFGIMALTQSGLFDLRGMAEQMAQEDYG